MTDEQQDDLSKKFMENTIQNKRMQEPQILCKNVFVCYLKIEYSIENCTIQTFKFESGLIFVLESFNFLISAEKGNSKSC